MAAALLAPARFLSHLPPSHKHHSSQDDRAIDEAAAVHSHGIHPEYDYVRSLITGERSARRDWSGARTQQQVFRIESPSVSRGVGIGGSGYRSLGDPGTDMDRTMATNGMVESVPVDEHAVAEETTTAPSSPPELSYSKSSKSSDSSIRSDSLSDDERSTEKLSNFDDEALQEDSERDSVDCNVKPENRPTLKRPLKRSSTPGNETQRHGMSPRDAARDFRYPARRGAADGLLHDQSLHIPHRRPRQRDFTSPSAQHVTMRGSHRVPSRSPSPGKSPAHSPQMPSATTPRSSWSAPSPTFNRLARTQSWQPGRKTTKQLEAEYDDGDEDLPDEVILENVPITPIPGQLRSKTPSPHRRPSSYHLSASHSNLHSANVPKNAKRPSGVTIMPNGQYGSPRSPRNGRPKLPHSATVASFPGEPLSHKHRSKSWTDDLNEEARHLSTALEEYASRLPAEKRQSGPSSIASNSPRPSLSQKRANTTIMELPQKQKGNVMIDPLPISKEKEAVLTRTRPSWLPPKSQKEEKKHIKEWEQMMAKAAEAEKKKVLRLQEQAENKEEMQMNMARIWEEHVLPNWDEVVEDPRTRELWWRGVTPENRGVVWQKALGNELALTHTSFEAALGRADELQEKIADMPPEERSRSKEAAWFDAIERDVPNTYPNLDVFNLQSPVGRALGDVLRAYAMYRSDVGYVYGTHLVAGILCLYMRAPEAFVALANMLNRSTPLAFLVHETSAMARAHELVLGTLKYKSSNLHAHLTSPATGLQPAEYLDPIFRCLFGYNLPPEHVSRLWDIYVFEGDKTLVRAAVAVLGQLEGKLYGGKREVLELIGWQNGKNWDIGSEEDFIKAVRVAGKVDAKGEVQSA